MPKQETFDGGTYITILSSDASFRKKTNKDDPNAEVREYETSDGTTGIKYEIKFHVLTGLIDNMFINEGEWGKQVFVGMAGDEDSDEVTLVINLNTPYGEDFLKKAPEIDYEKPVRLQPFNFTDEEGRNVRGIKITQDGEKVVNHYKDTAGNPINGIPQPDGDTKKYDKDDWKVYFTGVRKFLIGKLEEEVLPKFPGRSTASSVNKDYDYPTADEENINPGDSPF